MFRIFSGFNFITRFSVLLACVLGMAACTTTSVLPPQACQLGHVAVQHLPTTVRNASLRRVFNDDNDKTTPDQLMKDRQQLDVRVGPVMMAALAQAGVQPLAGSELPQDGGRVGHPLEASALRSLQAIQPADAYLRWQVTDYGETPVRWAGAYATFEVVTTLAIAGAFYMHKVTRPVAGVYLLQEGVEELSEGYAGFWALNRLSRPVRIEADLIDGHTGDVIWHDSKTGVAAWRWHHLWYMDNSIKDGLLRSSIHKATTEIANDVKDYFTQSCLSARLRS